MAERSFSRCIISCKIEMVWYGVSPLSELDEIGGGGKDVVQAVQLV